jgi:hypothetical protein
MVILSWQEADCLSMRDTKYKTEREDCGPRPQGRVVVTKKYPFDSREKTNHQSITDMPRVEKQQENMPENVEKAEKETRWNCS